MIFYGFQNMTQFNQTDLQDFYDIFQHLNDDNYVFLAIEFQNRYKVKIKIYS